MGCQDVRNQLSAYLEDELGVAPRRVVEDHLRECVRCQGELVLLQRTVALLRGLDELEVPARLADAVGARIAPRKTFDWGRLASWLFFPIHVKLPIQAVALLLVSLGAVYLYRTAPELAQAPAPPPVATESIRRDQPAPPAAPRLDDLAAKAPAKQSAPESAASPKPPKERDVLQESAAGTRAEIQEERESLRQRDLAGSLRKEAPAESRAAPLVRELTLKTQDPSSAALQIAEIATRMGGRLIEARGQEQPGVGTSHQLVLNIPPEAYPRFVIALRELGDLSPLPADLPSGPSPEAAVIVYLRLSP